MTVPVWPTPSWPGCASLADTILARLRQPALRVGDERRFGCHIDVHVVAGHIGVRSFQCRVSCSCIGVAPQEVAQQPVIEMGTVLLYDEVEMVGR